MIQMDPFPKKIVLDTSDLFAPLENVISDQFFPALIGHLASDVERQVLALSLG